MFQLAYVMWHVTLILGELTRQTITPPSAMPSVLAVSCVVTSLSPKKKTMSCKSASAHTVQCNSPRVSYKGLPPLQTEAPRRDRYRLLSWRHRALTYCSGVGLKQLPDTQKRNTNRKSEIED